MPAPYRHRQFSLYAVCSFVAVTIAMGAAFFSHGFEWPMLPIFLGMAAFMAVVHFLWAFLTVEVSERELMWHFGGGFWPNRIARSDIARVERVPLAWWLGIGIRHTPRTWIYLVAPGAGIEVTLTDGQRVCIGTDDPEGLAAALQPA
jgi:hypothetical protein